MKERPILFSTPKVVEKKNLRRLVNERFRLGLSVSEQVYRKYAGGAA